MRAPWKRAAVFTLAVGGLCFLPGADLFLDGGAHRLEVETHFLEHADGHALAELDQAEENVLGPDVVVMKPVGFLAREGKHLLRAGREIVHRFGCVGHGISFFR